MDNRPVLFIDSGIGGLPYCMDFLKKNPQEEAVYLADTQNFPYGPRSKSELENILNSLVEKLLKTTDPKIIVIACNTATVSALDMLRENYKDILFVGTVPAIKPAASASKNGRVGVLGSLRTIEDPYNQQLAKECEKTCEIIALAAPELVEFVEHKLENADKQEKTEIVKKYINIFREKNADTLVLGCTHFLHLQEEFKQEANGNILIIDSLDGITKRIESLLDEKNGKLRSDRDYPGIHWLLLTGKQNDYSSWQERAFKMDFALCMLDEI